MRVCYGYVYTRDPINGNNELYGDFRINEYINEKNNLSCGKVANDYICQLFSDRFEKEFPHLYKKFYEMCKSLESHFGDMQRIEFSISNDEIFILSTEIGKRTASAALEIACEMQEKKTERNNNNFEEKTSVKKLGTKPNKEQK